MLWWDHVGKAGADARYAREMEVYLGMCRRWREMPKPTIAMVQGACIAGGLMLAWCCDLIIAADDGFFADPVVRMGIPGVEYFAHPWLLGPRFAKEVLFTGERFGADRAYQVGMVNRVVPRADLAPVTFALAGQIATMPAFGLMLAKRAVNQCEDQMGMRAGMDSVFGLHHLAHAHNAETAGDSLAGQDARSMKQAGANDQAGFRAEVRDWLRAHVPATPLPSVDTAEGFDRHRDGSGSWPTPGWPSCPGPPSTAAGICPLLDWLVFEEEYHAAGGPVRVGQNGLFLLAPTLFAHGTAEQRDRLAAPDGPGRRRLGAGLVRAGGGQRPGRDPGPRGRGSAGRGWRLSGSKTWSTRAAFADRAFGLFRSEPGSQRHRGPDLPDVRPARGRGDGTADPPARRRAPGSPRSSSTTCSCRTPT